MLCKQLKVYFKGYKKRFNREIMVKSDISLAGLGCILVNVLNGSFEHFFIFMDQDTAYIPKTFAEQGGWEKAKLIADYTIDDLSNKFEFIYDADYEFVVEVSEDEIEIDNDALATIVSGKGQGIWEDNIRSLYAYLDGEITNDEEENEDEGIFFPWNVPVEKFSDFDNPLDYEEIQDFLDTVESDIYDYEENFDNPEALENFSKEIDEDDLFSEEQEEQIDRRFKIIIERAVKEQISTLLTVREEFERLCQTHLQEEVIEMIGDVLVEMINDCEGENKDFDEMDYFNRLKELK